MGGLDEYVDKWEFVRIPIQWGLQMLWTTLVKPFCQYAAYKNSYKVGTFFF